MTERTDDTTPIDALHAQREADSLIAGDSAGGGCSESRLPSIDIHQVHTKPDIPRIISHFDKLQLVAKVSPEILRHGLEGAFGKGTTIRKEVNGRYHWLLTFPGTNLFCSRYAKYGWSWVSVPGHTAYLSLLGHIANESNIHFRLQSVELAFDIPFPDQEYRQVEIIVCRVAHRLAVKHGRGIRVTSYSGDEFQECADDAVNGKHTFYLHSLNQDLLRRLDYKRPGKFISTKTKVYPKKLNDTWHVRIEITMRRAAQSLISHF